MFGIGFFELIVIAVVALVFVGPSKLPDLMRQAGKFFVQMRRTTQDVKSTFDQVVRDAETELRREEQENLRAALALPVAASASSPNADTHHHDDHHHADESEGNAPASTAAPTPTHEAPAEGVQTYDPHHTPDEPAKSAPAKDG